MTPAAPSRRRVVVTGMGVVSAAGTTLGDFWSTLSAGRSCVRTISRFDASGFPSRIAGEVTGFDEEAALGRFWPAWRDRGRIAQWAMAATLSAVEDAALPLDPGSRERTGVVVATGLGTYGHAEVFGPVSASRASRSAPFDGAVFGRELLASVEPLAAERRTPGSVPARVARDLGLLGPVSSVMTACAGGTQALGDAARWIRTGRCDAVLAGASDSELYPMGLASFCLLGALSRRNDEPARASRPFDLDRDGFVIGEGAGVLVLEERERALRRGARIRAEVLGFGGACDAWRATDPHPEGTGALLAMRRALEDAGLGPEAVGYVNAHGTSTLEGDRVEALALSKLLGERLPSVPVSSTKSMLGHLTVAAGSVEAIATVLSLEEQVIPPTLNQETPDPACSLDTVPNAARRARFDVALSNSFAFGGQTAALLLSRGDG